MIKTEFLILASGNDIERYKSLVEKTSKNYVSASRKLSFNKEDVEGIWKKKT